LIISDNAPYPSSWIGRNYTPPAGGALRPAGGFLRKADDFCSASIITEDVTLPLRWLLPATPL